MRYDDHTLHAILPSTGSDVFFAMGSTYTEAFVDRTEFHRARRSQEAGGYMLEGLLYDHYRNDLVRGWYAKKRC